MKAPKPSQSDIRALVHLPQNGLPFVIMFSLNVPAQRVRAKADPEPSLPFLNSLGAEKKKDHHCDGQFGP